MRAVYVPLRADVKDALLTLAEREARDPRRQAARLLHEGLIRRVRIGYHRPLNAKTRTLPTKQRGARPLERRHGNYATPDYRAY